MPGSVLVPPGTGAAKGPSLPWSEGLGWLEIGNGGEPGGNPQCRKKSEKDGVCLGGWGGDLGVRESQISKRRSWLPVPDLLHCSLGPSFSNRGAEVPRAV